MCATQWFTPINGTSSLLESVRATDAPMRKHGQARIIANMQ